MCRELQKAYSMTKPIRLEHLQNCIDWCGGARTTHSPPLPTFPHVAAERVLRCHVYDLPVHPIALCLSRRAMPSASGLW
jgi:type I restriction enzyme M protein